MIKKPAPGQTLGEWMETLPIRHMAKASILEIEGDPSAVISYLKFADDPLTRKIRFVRQFEGDDWVKQAIDAMTDAIYAEVRNLKRFDIWWTVIPELHPETKRAACMLMIRPVADETKH